MNATAIPRNILSAITAQEAGGGQFIGPNGPNEKKGYPARVPPVDTARDEGHAERLWQLSEDLTGVRPDFPSIKSGDA